MTRIELAGPEEKVGCGKMGYYSLQAGERGEQHLSVDVSPELVEKIADDISVPELYRVLADMLEVVDGDDGGTTVDFEDVGL